MQLCKSSEGEYSQACVKGMEDDGFPFIPVGLVWIVLALAGETAELVSECTSRGRLCYMTLH